MKVLKTLKKLFPTTGMVLKYSSNWELLVSVILSAQCTDKRVNIVTGNLFRKYRTADDYANADRTGLEEEIRSTGFYKNKAGAIINCCKKIVGNFSGNLPSSVEELTSLNGVGRKTANVVLGGAFGKQAIAVDTHVLRVSKRLGLASSTNPDSVEQALMKQVSPDRWTRFSLAMIIHGRQVCKARRPLCRQCPLREECEWPEKEIG